MKLAVPTILSSLVMMLYNLADTYFVGLLNDPLESSGVTLAAPVLLAFNAVNNLFGVGSSSMMSRALGRHDSKTAYRSSCFGFYCAIISGIVFSVVCAACNDPLLRLLGADDTTRGPTYGYMFWTVYLGAAPSILNVVMAYLVRAEGSSLHASIGTMSGCILNMILDPIFIMPWGFGMRAAGAGCATFISNCVACCYFFVLLFIKRGRTFVSVNPKNFTVKRDIVKGVCAVGIPAAIQNLLNVISMTILNNFTASYGSNAVTAMGISQKVYMVPQYISQGVSQGVMPLVSYNYASKNVKRMKNAITFSTKLSLTVVVTMITLFVAFPAFFISIFMKNAEVVADGTHFLRGLSLSLPFLCVDFIAVAVFQAVGMGKESLIFAILRKVVLEIPAIYMLNYLFPMVGLGYARLVAEVVLATAAVIMLSKLFRRLEAQQPKAVVQNENHDIYG